MEHGFDFLGFTGVEDMLQELGDCLAGSDFDDGMLGGEDHEAELELMMVAALARVLTFVGREL